MKKVHEFTDSEGETTAVYAISRDEWEQLKLRQTY